MYPGKTPEHEELRSRFDALCSGMPQKEIAELLQVSPETVHRYRCGHTAIPAVVIVRLCRRLEISSSWLLLGAGPRRATEEFAHAASRLPLDQIVRIALDALRRMQRDTAALTASIAAAEHSHRGSGNDSLNAGVPKPAVGGDASSETRHIESTDLSDGDQDKRR